MSKRPPVIVDTHCHLDFTVFDDDRLTVLNNARQHGVHGLVIPATQRATWQTTVNCASACHVDLALGLHPVFIDHHQPYHLSDLADWVTQHNPIAIGEIGLDFHKSLGHGPQQFEKQILFFKKQLLIAQRCNKPVIIHNRKAHDKCLALLHEIRVPGGIIHAFNGSLEQAKHYQALGFCLGFGGMLTFGRSSKLHALVKAVSLEHIVLETDAPDMTVASHQGHRNSPEYLPEVLSAVAHHKQLDESLIAEHTTQNAQRVLGPLTLRH